MSQPSTPPLPELKPQTIVQHSHERAAKMKANELERWAKVYESREYMETRLVAQQKDIYQLIQMVEKLTTEMKEVNLFRDECENELEEHHVEIIRLRQTLAPKLNPLLLTIQRLWQPPKTPKGEEIQDDTQAYYVELVALLREVGKQNLSKDQQHRVSELYGKISKNIQFIRMLNMVGDIEYDEVYHKEITLEEQIEFRSNIIDGPPMDQEHILPLANPHQVAMECTMSAKNVREGNIIKEDKEQNKTTLPLSFKVCSDKDLNIRSQTMGNLNRSLKAACVDPERMLQWKAECIVLGLESYEELQHHYRDKPEDCPSKDTFIE